MTPTQLAALAEVAEAAKKEAPLPWTVDEWKHYAEPRRPRFRIQYTATDRMNAGAEFDVAQIEVRGIAGGVEADRAVAEFIVSAVNNHEALVAATQELAELKRLAREHFAAFDAFDWDAVNYGPLFNRKRDAERALRAALITPKLDPR